MTLVCLAVWLPATQHCRLENVPGLGFLHCESDSPGDSDCKGDSCDAVEHGAYKVPDNADLEVLPILAPVPLEPVLVVNEEPVSLSHPLALVFAVPEISPESWQSFSTLALPIRGPSFSS